MDGRQLKILEVLIKNTTGIIGLQLASRLGVSGRTIRNDISKINKYLKGYDCSILSSTKKGYYLENVPLIASLIVKFQDENILDDVNNRYMELIGKIMFTKEQEIVCIADEIHVSPQTVYKDLVKIQAMISSKLGGELFKISNDYIYTTNDEGIIRKAFLMLLEKQTVRKSTSYQMETAKLLDGHYDVEDFEEFKNRIKSLFKDNMIVLSDDTFFMLSWALYFTNIRNQNEYYLDGIYTNEKTSKMVVELLMNIVQEFEFIYETDIGFLDSFMWSLKLFDHSTKDIGEKHQAILSEFCKDVQNKYGFDLKESEEVYNNMAIHTDFMLRRLEEGYEYENVIKDRIREKYAYAYEIAMLFVPIVYRHKSKYLNDSEISYIALYIECYFENVFKSIHVVLVSSSLPGIVNFTKQWIENNFSNQILIVDTIPVHQLDEFLKMVEVDLVISMTDIIKSDDKPVYVIDGLPKDSDRTKIYEALMHSRYKDKVERLISHKFNQELIHIYTEKITFDEVIINMSKDMDELNYIENFETFSRDVIEREVNYPTFLSNNIMVPHPLSNFAKKSVVSVAILKEPIKHKERVIKLIFLVANEAKEDEEIQELFQLLRKITPDKRVLEKLTKTNDSYEFLSELSNVFI